MDAVRRLVTETLIPIATVKLKSRLARRALNKVKSITGEKVRAPRLGLQGYLKVTSELPQG
jgi:hypothetical protein